MAMQEPPEADSIATRERERDATTPSNTGVTHRRAAVVTRTATGRPASNATSTSTAQPAVANGTSNGSATTTATSAPVAEAPGYLSLDTTPYSVVSEGGRTIGTTPLLRVPLAPGAHTLTLRNPEQGLSTTYQVTIRSGETVSRRLGLE
jgi:serine/threonine-protein kinase